MKLLIENFTQQINEVKESIRRMHERLDQVYKAGLITRADCENYRQQCPAYQDAKDYVTKEAYEKDQKNIIERINGIKGVPVWATVLFSVSSGLIVGIGVYALNH